MKGFSVFFIFITIIFNSNFALAGDIPSINSIRDINSNGFEFQELPDIQPLKKRGGGRKGGKKDKVTSCVVRCGILSTIKGYKCPLITNEAKGNVVYGRWSGFATTPSDAKKRAQKNANSQMPRGCAAKHCTPCK